MSQTAIFRFLVLASLVLAILGSLVDFFMPGLVPQELNDAYEAYDPGEPQLWLALAMGILALVLVVGAIVGAVGLWLFKRWGRGLSFWLTASSIVTYPFLGPVLYSGWSLMLTEVGMMLWGAALAMAYFSELRLRFDGEGARVLAG
ncbi:hypothetical protein GCM10011487_00820 [Steroidobacter agaridevorans]|uniref:DUF2127 domain-containing protein n=1 Tax=Steroidobacter agaridevorans TaxID=2695856 RepID=A0A829Y631_9GAMM|nr:hypothetical protein [Steroidobacter agaridevorans]GFE78082.1 hypothetical protein GCM10011487_00820 [Steroidobacter agaridevorans]GFE91141.1 hypothetical protein GCM10011488_60950 [Steroidobacter agaridevorans]